MKILKHGKVEQRKFVCPDCGSVLVINRYEEPFCPLCRERLNWRDGEPYEEPTPTSADKERLAEMLYTECEIDLVTAREVAENLVHSGVTFRE